MKEYIDYINNETTICSLAFNHVDYTNNGDWRLCCKAPKIATREKYETIEKFWKSEEVLSIRKDMLENKKNVYCETPCYSLEGKNNAPSHRQLENKAYIIKYGKNKLKDKINDNEKLNINQLNSIEMRISNLCNLKCRMCSPKYSTKINKDWNEALPVLKNSSPIEELDKVIFLENSYKKYIKNPLSRLEPDEIKNILNATKSNLSRIVFTGGEPFMEPYLYEVIQELLPVSKNIDLRFFSNGTKLDNIEEFNYLFKEFKSTTIQLSCDGIQNTYEYVRQGSKWEYFADQALLLSNYNITLDFHIVLQIYNYNNLIQTVDWILSNFKYSNIEIIILDGPWYLGVYCLPKHIKEKMKNELISYAENMINSKKYNAIVYDKLIKIANNLHHTEDQKYLNQFAAVSDKYDEIQNVPITWRQLLPELNESFSKDSQAKLATE